MPQGDEEASVEQPQPSAPSYSRPDPLDPRPQGGDPQTRLEAIAGVVPSLLSPPPGCRFARAGRFAAPI